MSRTTQGAGGGRTTRSRRLPSLLHRQRYRHRMAVAKVVAAAATARIGSTRHRSQKGGYSADMHIAAAQLGDVRGTAEAASLSRRARAVDRRGRRGRRGGRPRHCCAADALQHAKGGEPLGQKGTFHRAEFS
eukprot:scaffold40940_cov54-Phaeocystis_antarctica.AAC.1